MDQVEEVKSKVDIVEVISSYIPLKKAGRNLSGLCPFHSEKTPSFMVAPERQVFKCFGCGEGGDVITFLEKIEGWEFREVLEELAKRVGVKLKSYRGGDSSLQKDKILAVNRTAAKFFSYLLLEHKLGEVGRQYLGSRGLIKSNWVKFGLGYAPDSWDRTIGVLVKKGFSTADIAASGLVVQREGNDKGFYDRFRGRLMFPIFDNRGSVVGFSGRVLGESREAKYVNSPETMVFNKGSILYGYFQTKDYVREKNEAILVEGEFDVLSLFAAGIKNVVASKGTALTENQVKILSRSAESVALCFDADLAGDKAARRGIELLDRAGLIVKVINLGKYKDPDEYVKHNAQGFREAVINASNFYDFLIASAKKRYDAATIYGKKKIGQELLPVISKISDEVVRAHYLGKLGRLLGVDTSLLASGKLDDGQMVKVDEGEKSEDRGKSLEEYFLALFLMGDRLHADFFNTLDVADFGESECRALWSSMHDIIKNSRACTKRKLLEGLPESFKSFVDSLYLLEVNSEFLDDDERAGEMVRVGSRIKELSLRNKLRFISERMRQAEEGDKQSEVIKLAKKFDELSQILKKGTYGSKKVGGW